MAPRTLVKNVQLVTLVVIILAADLKIAEGEECYRYIKTDNRIVAYAIGSPDYPYTYPYDSYCTWEFESPSNCTLILNFVFFELESSSNCSFDYLEFYEGSTTDNLLHGKFCGNNTPIQLQSMAPRNLLVFHSDDSISKKGFEALIYTECHYSIKTDNFINTSEVTSPNYPNFYPAHYKCHWNFETTQNCILKLRFYSFHLESNTSCGKDSVAVYDGNTTSDPLLGKFCGDETPPVIKSTTHRMLMIFQSDYSNSSSGFRAQYSTECLHFVPLTKYILTSPKYPDRYPHNYNSTWKFETTPGYAIRLIFDYFKLQSENKLSVCANDGVALYDGDSTEAKLMGSFCGSDIPHAIISTSHNMLVVFYSDEAVALGGFRATLSKVPSFKNITTDETERNLTQFFLNTRQHILNINKWGTEITRTAVALFLNDPRFFAPDNEIGEEIAYELSLQLISKLVMKKRISTTDLALFVNAMTVACINPKNFFGVNIVAQLRQRIDASNHANPFFMLALCNGGDYMKMEDVEKLQKLFSTHLKSSNTEIQAMVVMALKCIHRKNQPDRNLDNILNEMVLELKRKQQSNGTVGNLKNTALVVHALIATESYETDFNLSLAMQSIIKESSHTHVGVEELFYILPIFRMYTLLDINSNHCAHSIKTDLENIVKLREDPDEWIQVQMSVLIGDDVDFSRTWRIKVPFNFSFYQVLENISSTEPDYKFHYIISDGKPYVAGLENFKDSIAKDSFWFIYTKALSSADNLVLIEKSPVDIHVNETHEIILWYRSGPLSRTQELSSDASS